MKVTYKDYTGELVKLELANPSVFGGKAYHLTLKCEDGASVSFERVSIRDIRFPGATVQFGGE